MTSTDSTVTATPTPEGEPMGAQPSNGVDGDLAIRLTARALSAVRQAISESGVDGYALRVAVVGGGCSGYQHTLDLTNEVGPLDTVIEQDGVKMYVDMLSMSYLEGTTIDYVETPSGAGFKFENPNAVKTCGCGSSFSS